MISSSWLKFFAMLLNRSSSVMIILFMILVGASCSRIVVTDLFEDFRALAKDEEDLSIDFGTPDQAKARVIGFSINEFHHGRSFCWLPSTSGRVKFFIAEPSLLSLMINVRPFTPPGKPPQVLELILNGVSAGRHVLPPQWSDQFFRLPREAVRVGWNDLEITCTAVWSPNAGVEDAESRLMDTAAGFAGQRRSANKDDEGRKLGIAVSRIDIHKTGFGDQSLPERIISPLKSETGKTAVVQDPGTSIRMFRKIGPGTHLRAQVAAERQERDLSPPEILKASIVVRDQAGHSDITSADVSTATTDRRETLTLDLSSFAGSLVEVEVSVMSKKAVHPPKEARVRWSELSLIGPEMRTKEPMHSQSIFNEQEKKCDTVFLLIDTIRRDALGCYGNPLDTTPWLDLFSKKSYQFTQIHSQASWTRPSIASLFTGMLPEAHGVLTAASSLNRNLPRFHGRLQKRGTTTLAFSTNPQISKHFGFDEGFDEFYELFGGVEPSDFGPEQLKQLLSIDSLVDLVEKKLPQHAREPRPFFAYLHVMDPHSPYNPRPPFDQIVNVPWDTVRFHEPPPGRPIERSFLMNGELQRQTVTRYLGEVRITDCGLGRLLHFLDGLPRESFPQLIVTGDHGEEFWDHGGMGHGRWVFEETLALPLLIGPRRYPAIRTESLPVSDVIRRLVETQRESSGDMGGLSSADSDHYVFADELAQGPETFWHSCTNGTWKCSVRTRTTEGDFGILEVNLFNLRDDPQEQNNLAGSGQIIEGWLVEKLMTRLYFNRSKRFKEEVTEPRKADKALEQQLKMLGYTS